MLDYAPVEAQLDHSQRRAGDRYLKSADVQRRYGVSKMSIHRWLNDPDSQFPKPILISRYRYWSLHALLAWEQAKGREAA